MNGRAGRTAMSIGAMALAAGQGVRGQCVPEWSSGFAGILNDEVNTFFVHDDDGAGPLPPALYPGGQFTTAAGVSAQYLARWSGASWSGMNSAFSGYVFDIVVFDDDAAGPNPSTFFVGGGMSNYGHVVKRTATGWTGLASGTNNPVMALAIFDEDGAGPNPARLFVGGFFTSAGGVSVNRLGRWNGTNWSSVNGGIPSGLIGDLLVFDDDGDGPHEPALYAGGSFSTIGGVPASSIAKWNGTTWSALGSGLSGGVLEMTAFDADGEGPNPPALIAVGHFTMAGALTVNRIAMWNGTEWSALGAGFDVSAHAVAVHDEDGLGPNAPALFAGGFFTASGATPLNFIAKWTGSGWTALGLGVNGPVRSLTSFDEDHIAATPPGLFVGGDFTQAGGVPSPFIARWGCDASTICFADIAPSGGDGVVGVNDVNDLLAVVGAWGPCP